MSGDPGTWARWRIRERPSWNVTLGRWCQLKVRVPPPETYGEIMMHDAEMLVRATYSLSEMVVNDDE